MTDVGVIAQTITLFNAAYHTTTYALTWALFLLAQHPDVMARLHDEMQNTLGDGLPGPDDPGRLPLLDRVIKESLRMLPPVVYTPRISTRETELGPHRVPEGTIILASPYLSHHLPEVFPHPERFDPDRWLDGSISPWAYIPFGGGSRLCVGAPFATQVVKVALSVILPRFRLQVVPGACIERQGTLTLGAAHGVPVTLFDQDEQFTSSPVSGTIHEMVELPAVTLPAIRAA
jgi:cytochrome P450